MAKQFMSLGIDITMRNLAQFQSQVSRCESAIKQIGGVATVVNYETQQLARTFGVLGISMATLGATALSVVIPMTQLAESVGRNTLMGDSMAHAVGISTNALAKEREELAQLDTTMALSQDVLNGLMLQQLDVARASDLVSMALDLSAFSGRKAEETIRDLTQAVENANIQTLRTYEISASSTAIFDSYKREIGAINRELTEREKREATLNYLLAVGERIHGAYNASLTTSEGLSRHLELRIKRLGETMGGYLLPYVDALKSAVVDLIDSFEKLDPGIQKVIATSLALVGALGAVAGAITMILPGLRVVLTGLKALPAAIAKIPIELYLAANAADKFRMFFTALPLAVKDSFASMATVIPRLTGGIGIALKGIVGAAGAALKGLLALVAAHPEILAIAAAVALVATAIIKDFGGIRTAMKTVIDTFKEHSAQVKYNAKVWRAAWDELTVSPFEWIGQQVTKLSDKIADLLRPEHLRAGTQSFIQNWQDMMKGVLSGIESLTGEHTVRMEESLYEGGIRVMVSYGKGLIEGATAVIDAITDIANSIASFLVGWSPPKEGPLKNIDIGGMNIIKAWLDGMSSVSLDQVQQIAEALDEQLKRASWAVTDALFDLDVQELNLDKLLWPYEDAVTRAEAAATLITIPLERQLRELDKARREIDRQLQDLADASFDLDIQERDLDRVLWPYEDALERIRAAATLITIPLQRQVRVLEKELERLKDIEERERAIAEARIAALRAQREALQAIIDVDKNRLEVLNHEILMEQLRNRILERISSARLITLQSSARVLQDQVAQNEERVSKIQELENAEEARWKTRQAELQAQQQVIQDQIDALQELIQIQTDKVTYAEEELELQRALQVEARLAILQQRRLIEDKRIQLELEKRVLDRRAEGIEDLIEAEKEKLLYLQEELQLAEARQAGERLSIEQQRRFWNEQNMWISHFQDIVGRVLAKVKEDLKGGSDIIQDWENDMVGSFGNASKTLNKKFAQDVAAAKKKLAEMLLPLFESFNTLEESWETMKASLENLSVAVELHWKVDPWRTLGDIGRGFEASKFGQSLQAWGIQAAADVRFFVYDAWNAIKTWTDDTATKIETWASNTWTSIKNWAANAGPEIATWVANARMNFIGFTGGVGASIGGWSSRTGLAIKAWAANAGASIKSWADTAATRIETWVSDTWLAVKGWAADTWTTIKGWASDTWGSIKAWVSDTWRSIKSWASDTWMTIKGWASDTWASIKGWAGNTWGSIKVWASSSWGTIKSWAADTWLSIKGWAADTWTTIKTWVTDTLGTLEGWATEAWDTLTGWATDAATDIGLKLDEFLAAMNKWWTDTGVPDLLARGGQIISDIIKGATDAITNLAADINGIGASIVAGIEKGITDDWNRFVEWIKGKLGGLLGIIGSAIGMGSPARKLIPIGKSMADGIAKGFTDSMDSWQRGVKPWVMGAFEGFSRTVSATANYQTTNINNYYYTTHQGPSIGVSAQYSRPQSPGSIRDDISLMLGVAG